MKRILIALAVVVVGCIVAIVTLVSYVSRDIPDPDVADLAVDRPELPPAVNAYTH